MAEPERTIQLDQFLKLEGLVSSGGEAKILIQSGQVQVNGAEERRRGRTLVHGDRVTCGGETRSVSLDSETGGRRERRATRPRPPVYIHGTDAREQRRLEVQAAFLAPHVFAGRTFPSGGRILEVGCATGANGRYIRSHIPETGLVVGIDRSARQLDAAVTRARGISGLRFARADGAFLPFCDGSLDAIFTCWFFEHVPNPVEILRECRRVLREGSALHSTEVINQSLTLDPKTPEIMELWEAFGAIQKEAGGDPDVGVKMPDYLKAAGFSSVDAEIYPLTGSTEDPGQLALCLEELRGILESGEETVRARLGLDDREWKRRIALLDRLASEPGAGFRYVFMKTTARR